MGSPYKYCTTRMDKSMNHILIIFTTRPIWPWVATELPLYWCICLTFWRVGKLYSPIQRKKCLSQRMIAGLIVLKMGLQWNPKKGTPCCSSVSILMRPLMQPACMGAALLSRVRNGLQPNGSMSTILINLCIIQRVGSVSMRMRIALDGPREVSVRRTLHIWWAQIVLLVFVERVAMYVLLRKFRNALVLKLWIEPMKVHFFLVPKQRILCRHCR